MLEEKLKESSYKVVVFSPLDYQQHSDIVTLVERLIRIFKK